jgi:hypothetical protein
VCGDGVEKEHSTANGNFSSHREREHGFAWNAGPLPELLVSVFCHKTDAAPSVTGLWSGRSGSARLGDNQELSKIASARKANAATHVYSRAMRASGHILFSTTIKREIGDSVTASSRSVGGSALLLSLLAFIFGGSYIYSARHDLTVAKNEATASGQAYLHPQRKNSDIFDSLRCDYSFGVNDVRYVGHGMCPAQTDHSLKGTLENAAGLLQNPSVTVYYDPANPSTNSMMEFSAKSAFDNKKADLSILAGVILLLVVGVVYVIGGNNASQGVNVDSDPIVTNEDKSDSEQ